MNRQLFLTLSITIEARSGRGGLQRGGVMDALTISMAAAAEVLGIGETPARQLIERGELPVVRVSRRVLVPVQGLRDFVAGLATD